MRRGWRTFGGAVSLLLRCWTRRDCGSRDDRLLLSARPYRSSARAYACVAHLRLTVQARWLGHDRQCAWPGLGGFFFFNAPPTTEIYTLSLHDALPIFTHRQRLLE